MNKVLRFSVPLLFSILVFGIAAPSVFADAPSIIINEFSSASATEWVELLNTTGSSIDLAGWKLTELTNPSGTPVQADLLLLSGTISAGGVLAFDVGTDKLNNSGDSIGLYDNSGTPVLIHRIIYGTVAGDNYPTTTGLGTVPTAVQSGSFDGTNWSISSSPTKNASNGEGGGGGNGPDYTAIFGDIKTTLAGQEIDTNIDTCASVPTGCSGLYFEKTDKGRVTFSASMDLTASSTNTFLQGLGSKMEASAGSMKFDAQTAYLLKNAGAQIKIYGLNALGFTDVPNIVVKNDAGTVIPSTDGTNYPTLSGITYDAATHDGTLTFDASHFTTFETKKVLNVTTGVGYDTIQAAVTAASAGDTINVAAGTYAENVVIDKGLTLQGTAGATIAPTTGPGVEIDASPADHPVTVDSFTITPQGSALDSAQGIVIGSVGSPVATHNITISNNTITTAGQNMGILVRGVSTNGPGYPNSTGLTVTHNTITLSGDSTAMYASWVATVHSNWSITHNTFNSPVGTNLELYNVDGVDISNNIFEPSGSGGSGSVFIGAELDNALTGAVTFNNNDVQGNGAGGGSMVVFTTNLKTSGTATMGAVTISGNTFNNWDSRALLIHKAGVTVSGIRENKFLDSGQALDNRNGVLIDATNNWWGTAVVADVIAKISANGNVTYKPYYIDDTKTTLSDIKAITVFNFATPAATGIVNETAKTVAITVPFGTNVTALIPTITMTGVSVSPSFGVAQDFTNLVTYTVTAVDGTTQTYDVTVTVALNPAKAITAFNFATPAATGVINEINHTISVNVPNGTDVTVLIATFVTTGAGVSIGETTQISATTANNFATTKTYRVTAANGTTQDYIVTVTVLAATQVAPDNTGSANVDSTKPQVVITNPTQDVAVTISSGTTDAKIDVSSFISSGMGDIPKITITSTAGSGNAAAATIEIPATKVTSADATWNGVISAPTVTTVDLPVTSGETKTLGAAIEVGFASAKLSFDEAVRILLPNQAGKRAGYSRPGTDFTEITNICVADNQAAGDALAADSECKIDVGSDLVIWTKHFTKFASYTQTTNILAGSSGGNACGYGFVWNPDKMSCSQAVATAVTPTHAQGQVLGVAVYNFVNNLAVGSRGADVMALQQFLIDGGYAIPAGATGYFGMQTKEAVRAFQKAKGVANTGFVGQLTRAELNKGSSSSDLTISEINSVATALHAFNADEAIINKVRAILTK